MTYKEYMELLKSLVIETLEAGKNPWQLSETRVRNGFTNRPYNGANALFLTINSINKFNGDMRWYAFEQAKKLGCSVNKGEKATLAYYFQNTKTVAVLDEDGNIKKDENGKPITETRHIPPIFKVYHVFNARQLSPVPEISAENQLEYSYDEKLADSFIYTSPAMISFAQGQGAFYSPINDIIQVPPKESYPHNIEAFYSTTFHEIAHSTGHSSRLDRINGNSSLRFGSPEYAREELVAEITALSLCEKCDMKYTRAESAMYVASWLSAIKDPSFSLISLYSDVSKASRFIQHPEDRQRLIEQTKENNHQEVYQFHESKEIPNLAKEKEPIYSSESNSIKVPIYNSDTDNLTSIEDNGSRGCYYLYEGKPLGTFYPHIADGSVVLYEVKDGSIKAEAGNVDGSLSESLVHAGYDANDLKPISFEQFVYEVNKQLEQEKDYWQEPGTQIQSTVSENDTTPIVRFTRSDYPMIPSKDRTLSILEAERLIESINNNLPEEDKNVYKTSFTITFSLDGKIQTYSGNYYIGRDFLPFIERISSNANYFLDNKEVQKKYAEEHGEEKLQENIENKKAIATKVVTYLNLHKELASQEEIAKALLDNSNKEYPSTADKEMANYSVAMLDFIKESRVAINNGNLLTNVFSGPKKETYQYAMPTDRTLKKVYISGPITNDPYFDKSFKDADKALRECGFEPVNPVELVKGKLPEGASPAETWRRAMEIDLEALKGCDAMVLLDRKFCKSTGMDIEYHVATSMNLPIVSFENVLSFTEQKNEKEFSEARAIVEKELATRLDKLSFFDMQKKKGIKKILSKSYNICSVVLAAGKENLLSQKADTSRLVEKASDFVMAYDLEEVVKGAAKESYKPFYDVLEKEPVVFITNSTNPEVTGIATGDVLFFSEASERIQLAKQKINKDFDCPKISFAITAKGAFSPIGNDKTYQTIYGNEFSISSKDNDSLLSSVKRNISQNASNRFISRLEKHYFQEKSNFCEVIKNQIKPERDKSLSMSI